MKSLLISVTLLTVFSKPSWTEGLLFQEKCLCFCAKIKLVQILLQKWIIKITLSINYIGYWKSVLDNTFEIIKISELEVKNYMTLSVCCLVNQTGVSFLSIFYLSSLSIVRTMERAIASQAISQCQKPTGVVGYSHYMLK